MNKNLELAEYVLNNCTMFLGVEISKIDHADVFFGDIKQHLGYFDKDIDEFVSLLQESGIIDKVSFGPASRIKEDMYDQAYSFEVSIPKLKEFIKKESQNNTTFDSIKSCVIYKSVELPIPKNSKQFYFCSKMYEYPTNQFVSWDIIFDEMEAISLTGTLPNKEKWKVIYDTMTEINKKAKEKLGLDQLFKYEKKEFLRTT